MPPSSNFPTARRLSFGTPAANHPWERGNGVAFAVADAHEAVAELRLRGVTIGDPVDDLTCRMAIGEDSEGNQLVIHQRKP